ncbi:propionyl-CoA carboxylase [Gonapodya prolifera JEL478]|uniref:Propionyl-CoA carboxylase beta chain, mitochondrial n=1 Tax=Gonapodya prolifera (strain JEL478) TaxID=1344416 RepID=A0A139A7A9_GONPJ|nr:propionyl-CoA carboxylase [Gonapodya prolifera JEL478]|eukprot:KXS12233.1 propionyl-CoA carboxylase [Gonapodya prolifera JEL478]
MKRVASIAQHLSGESSKAEQSDPAKLPTSLTTARTYLSQGLPPRPELKPENPKNPWENKLAELEWRKSIARIKFEDDRGVTRQRTQGKLLVRERLELLIDPGSLREHGSIAGTMKLNEDGSVADFQPANFVAGRANINGRPVIIGADDFTVRGGHQDGAIAEKQGYAERIARQYRVPCIRLLDGSSGGGSVVSILQRGYSSLPIMYGFGNLVRMLDEIPVVAMACGPTVGLASARATVAHFTIGCSAISSLFAAGPPMVVHATHERLTNIQLGGCQVMASNGTFDNIASTEEGCFDLIRRFLSYLPMNRWGMPPITPPPRREALADWEGADRDRIMRVIPTNRKKPYDPRDYLRCIVDPGSLFEIGTHWGKSHGIFFARICGFPVGIMASDPRFEGGAMTADSANKLGRFAGLCSTFHLPVIDFVDCPGFAIGTKAEKAGTVRAGSRLAVTLYESKVPFFVCVVRKGYGVATGVIAGRGHGDVEYGGGQDVRVGWISMEVGGPPLEGGIEAAFKRDLEAIKDPQAREKERAKIDASMRALIDPLISAEHFAIEEVIDPRDTRQMVQEWLEIVYQTRIPELIVRDTPLKTGGGAYAKIIKTHI